MTMFRKKTLTAAYRLDPYAEVREMPDWLRNEIHGKLKPQNPGVTEDPHFVVETNHGPVRADYGDWIIRGENEIYPCKDEVFRATYEPADSEFYES